MWFREVNKSKCKTYLIACKTTNQAALVDPLRDRIDRYLALLAYHGYKLRFTIDTHTHADHRTGCYDLRDMAGGLVVMHRLAPTPRVDLHVEDGQRLSLGEITLKVIHTPGHTPDSICLYVKDKVLTGDTLLIGGTGRADFPGSDPGAQWDAIVAKLFTLPDETLVYPAHDYRGHLHSTIGTERATNPRIAGRTRADYIELMNNLGLPQPDNIEQVLQPNQCALEYDEVNFPNLGQLNLVCQLSPREVSERMAGTRPPLLLDIREPEEFCSTLGHLDGIIRIPLKELPARAFVELGHATNRDIVVICRTGERGLTAAAMLTALGFKQVFNLRGGMLGWFDERLPVIGVHSAQAD